MINKRLFDHYGIDTTKDLKIKNRCPRPFDTLLIDKNGSCFACECQAWLPQSVGNLRVHSMEQVMNSAMRLHLKASIEDGSYRYCNENQCTYILNTMVEHTSDTDKIKQIRLAIDDSCNLRCPSCRDGMRFHKNGSAYETGIMLADKINKWLEGQAHPILVHIGSDGDPFASHVYRYFMRETPKMKNISYSILTNGLLFNDFHEKVPEVVGRLKELGISIDGATKNTYERLRLGGSWQKMQDNLKTISELKKKNNFWFRFHMVVQQDNWREMMDIVNLGNKYGVDEIYFNKIQDWQTALDYSRQNFTQLDEFMELRDQISKLNKRYSLVGL